MFVVTVVPLTRVASLQTLSYFSGTSYETGSVVSIPIRSREVWGLIVECKSVSTAKTALRAATFSLRKLPTQKSHTILSPSLLKTAHDASAYYGIPLGMILYTLIPPPIRNGDVAFPHTDHARSTHTFSPHLLHASHKERFTLYRSYVREAFAHGGSVIIVVPSSTEAHDLKQILASGIDDRLVLITSASTPSEIKAQYARIDDYSKTRVIITTPTHALIERHDITTIILEHTRSPFYRNMVRPMIDWRTVLTMHARHTGRKIIYGDILHRAEDEHLRRLEIYHTEGEEPKRIDLPGALVVVTPTRKEEKKSFSLFTQEATAEIEETINKKGRVFMFAARRGLAPLVMCGDCGYVFRSSESGVPYSLIRTTTDTIEKRWFVCSSTGEKIPAADICPECTSWRLVERGIGIQHVYDTLHKEFPTIPVILFDHISARTYKKALFLRDTFYKKKGVILLGTHMALPYLNHPVDTSIVVNMDALLATPTWRLDEENMSLLLTLRERTHGTVMVQTRSPDTQVFDYARHGSLEQFYTSELAVRKTFLYPPYSTFIHFMWDTTHQHGDELGRQLQSQFAEYDYTSYGNPSAPNGHTVMYGLIRYHKSAWPEAALTQKLMELPSTIQITINPDRII